MCNEYLFEINLETIEIQIHIFLADRNSFKMLAVEIILRYFT